MAKHSITRRCSACKRHKPITEFYKDGSRADGIATRCKICARASIDKYKASAKGMRTRAKYLQSEVYAATEARLRKTERYAAYFRAYYKANRPACLARSAVKRAVRKGTLKPIKDLRCTCGRQAVFYHHNSYKKKDQLKVTPLCGVCHRSIHASGTRLVHAPPLSHSV